MPLQSTSGAASYDAFGGGAAAKVNYIEDFFQSYLRTGTGASATVTTGLDGSTKETLVWTKSRSAATNHKLTDNVRGATKALSSNTTGAEATDSQGLTAFSATGYTIGTNTDYNNSGATYVDWQWVAQPKFFDVVTFTGTQNSSGTGQVVSHNLGSTPACIIVKPITDTSGTGFSIADWIVYHRSLSSPTTQYLKLNSTAAIDGNSDKIRAVSDTTFTAGWEIGYTGIQYVAYVFAHNAGGFGLTGTDNVISCGSFTTNGSGNATVSLGYEPQWVLVKGTGSGFGWSLFDNMRGMPVTGDSRELLASSSSAEGGIGSSYFNPTATGFYMGAFSANQAYIYIAIRRGPMKVPTSGTSVYETITSSATAGTVLTTGFPVDLQMQAFRSTTGAHRFMDRLRGVSTNSTAGSISLASTSTAAETTTGSYSLAWNNTGFQMTTSFESTSGVFWNFRRAPSFFDEVCYTGTGSATTFSHNLGVAPELMIVKDRTYDWGSDSWAVYSSALGATKYLALSRNVGEQTSSSFWNDTAPTASVFTVGTIAYVNAGGDKYVAYLFATCAGVSKVGSYTGTGTTLQVDCGFTGGARFVLIKRTDSTGDWYVWDSARGIVSGNDPYLLLNSTAAEVTSTDYIDTYSAGFEISSTAPAAINASGGSFIFLAVA